MRAPSTPCCTRPQQRCEGTRGSPTKQTFTCPVFLHSTSLLPSYPKGRDILVAAQSPETRRLKASPCVPRQHDTHMLGKEEGRRCQDMVHTLFFFHLRCYSFLGLLLPGLPHQPDSQLVGILRAGSHQIPADTESTETSACPVQI